MRRQLRTLLCLVILSGPLLAFAQRTIKGIVTDDNKDPVPGVTVSLKGSTAATATDGNGKYSIRVQAGRSILIFKGIGFAASEVQAGTSDLLSISLHSSIKNLNELVVTGYSSQRKGDIIGAVSVVSAKDVRETPTANIGQALQGKVPGVVIGNDANPGGEVSIRIRGIGTINNNDPLIIIDGVQSNGGLNDINSTDIESVQVLKDASSASIYGSRASSGVLIITTKHGLAGPAKLNLEMYTGTQQLYKTPRLLNPLQFAGTQFMASTNDTLPGTPISSQQYGAGLNPVLPDYIDAGGNGGLAAGNPAVNPNLYNYSSNRNTFYQIVKANKSGTNWFHELFRPALIQNYNLSASGGTETSRFNFSAGYFNQNGTVKDSYFKRYSFRANSDFTIRKFLHLGENLALSYTDGNSTGPGDIYGNPVSEAYRILQIIPVYDIKNNFAGTQGPELGDEANPVASQYRNKNNFSRGLRLLGDIFAEATLFRGLKAKTLFGLDYSQNNSSYFSVPNPEQKEGNFSNTAINVGSATEIDYNFSNTLSYNTVIAGKHHINAVAGIEAVENNFRNLGGIRSGFNFTDLNHQYLDAGNPSSGQVNNGTGGDNALFSSFAKADYSYADKYLLTATFRRDGSSRFGSNYRFANFAAAGAAWRLSEEPFMKALTWITDLKVRAGYGKTGNQKANGNYPTYSQYFSISGGPYGNFPNSISNGYDLNGTSKSVLQGYSSLVSGNPNLKWESTTDLNTGLDASLFDGRLTFVADLYRRLTTDMLVQPAQPSTLGSPIYAPTLNAGTLRNKGLDMSIDYSDHLTNGFKYSAGLNFAVYRNKLLKIDNNGTRFLTDPNQKGKTQQANAQFSYSYVDKPVGQFYGYRVKGIYQNRGQVAADKTIYPDPSEKAPGLFQFEDINKDGTLDTKDIVPIGDPNPKFTYGLNLSASYKNFDFSMFLQGVYGNQVYNFLKYYTDFNQFFSNKSIRYLTNSWTPGNTAATLPRLSNNATITAFESIPSSAYIENGSYLRAKNLQIGYTLPAALSKKMNIDRLRFYVQAVNLFTISPYSGLDPDITVSNYGSGGDLSRGVDYGQFPSARQFLVGLNLSF